MQKNISYIKIILRILISTISSASFAVSDVYLYQLYLHSEYKADPPGLPQLASLSAWASKYTQQLDNLVEKRLLTEAIGSLRLTHKHAWVECIAGVGKETLHIRQGTTHSKASRSGFDDVLIDCGYNVMLGKAQKGQLSLHLLTGIPTYLKVTVADTVTPLLGTRTINFGPELELSYDMIRTEAQDLFANITVRFLHQFSRRYYPILPADARYHPGNTTDILFRINYRQYVHTFEVGYVPTIVTNIAYKFPTYTQHLPSEKFSSVYGLYGYYAKKISLAFQTGAVGTFNASTRGWTWFGGLLWFF